MTNPLSDEDLLAQLEACTLPPEQFHHADHLHAAWVYLKKFPALEAIARFSNALRAYAAALGKPDRYHETITWAYLLLIHERVHRGEGEAGWEAFAAANVDLLDWKSSTLRNYYREGTLDSRLAREIFVMPDRAIDLGD